MRHLEAQLGGAPAAMSAGAAAASLEGNVSHSSADQAPLMPPQLAPRRPQPQGHVAGLGDELAAEGVVASNSVAPLLPPPLPVPNQEVRARRRRAGCQ